MSLAACSFLTGWTTGGGEGEEGTARMETPAPTSLRHLSLRIGAQHSVSTVTVSLSLSAQSQHSVPAHTLSSHSVLALGPSTHRVSLSLSTQSQHSVPTLQLPGRGQPPPAECRSARAERPGSGVPGRTRLNSGHSHSIALPTWGGPSSGWWGAPPSPPASILQQSQPAPAPPVACVQRAAWRPPGSSLPSACWGAGRAPSACCGAGRGARSGRGGSSRSPGRPWPA